MLRGQHKYVRSGGTREQRPGEKIDSERDKEDDGEVNVFSHRKPLELVHLCGQVGSVHSHWEALHRDGLPRRTAAKVSFSTKRHRANANGSIMRFIPTCTFEKLHCL